MYKKYPTLGYVYPLFTGDSQSLVRFSVCVGPPALSSSAVHSSVGLDLGDSVVDTIACPSNYTSTGNSTSVRSVQGTTVVVVEGKVLEGAHLVHLVDGLLAAQTAVLVGAAVVAVRQQHGGRAARPKSALSFRWLLPPQRPPEPAHFRFRRGPGASSASGRGGARRRGRGVGFD